MAGIFNCPKQISTKISKNYSKNKSGKVSIQFKKTQLNFIN